jgi:hypothetical protein
VCVSIDFEGFTTDFRLVNYLCIELTRWSRALLEKPLVTCYGTRRCIIVFTKALYWTLF